MTFTHQVTDDFATPFAAGLIATTDETPWPFPIALAGIGYVIDLRYYTRGIVDPFRQAQDVGAQPGERTLNPLGAWKRTRADWRRGAGQEWADVDNADDSRFYRSKGVDIWTEYQACMLPTTEEKLDSANTNLPLIEANSYLYVGDGADVKHTGDPTPASPTWTTIAAGGTVNDFATDGERVWVAVDGVGLKYQSAGAGSLTAMPGAAATYDAEAIGYANGWLLGGSANKLDEIAAAGGVTNLLTHRNTGFLFTAILGTPSGIYAGGNVGDRAEIYYTTVDPSTGNLATPIWAGDLPAGETVHSMRYYQSRVLIGTSKGIRVADVLDGGGLSIGPLIETGKTVYDCDGEGRFVWFGWSDYDASSSGLGRADLALFNAPEQPVYASDLMADATGDVKGVVSFEGRRYFSVSGEGVYGETANKVATATLELGWLTFNIWEAKALISASLVSAPLEGQLSLSFELEDGTTIVGGTFQTAKATAPSVPFSLSGTGDKIKPIVTWTRHATDATKGPCLHRLSVRALPIPRQIEVWRLPIMAQEHVKIGAGEGEDHAQDGLAIYRRFLGYARSQEPIRLQEGKASNQVTVRRVQIPEGLATGWRTERSFPDSVVFVEVASVTEV